MSMLAPFIGKRWACFIAGETMTHHMFSPVEVLVNTTNGAAPVDSR